MSEDQFRAYRQTGMYGGYRLAFRKWPGMTLRGDGWTPGLATNQLAKWLDDKMGAAGVPWPIHAGDGDENGLSTRSAKLSRGKECEWWLRKWGGFSRQSDDTCEDILPSRKRDFGVLPEAGLLKPRIFGSDPNGRRRFEVAQAVVNGRATEHIEICEHLARVFRDQPAITLLPRFSRLADAGIMVMELIAEALQKESSVPLEDLAALPTAKAICEELVAASREWLREAELQVRHIETANRFANWIPGTDPFECLRAVIQYHEVYGGGLRWFVLREGRIEPRTVPRGGSSRYRFRLWALCRLAAQCGAIRKMPSPDRRLRRGKRR
ncbi:MAG: hypothetical protein IPP47_06915 [Bryobacterales bacterium]|nr:hypothetical protein [Bryobacterales bacterium]